MLLIKNFALLQLHVVYHRAYQWLVYLRHHFYHFLSCNSPYYRRRRVELLTFALVQEACLLLEALNQYFLVSTSFKPLLEFLNAAL